MSNLDLLAGDSDAVARAMVEQLRRLDSAATSSELMYTPMGSHSFYRDLLAAGGMIQGVPGAQDRLNRHGEQMRNVNRERRRQAQRQLRAGQFEYRVTPNTNVGTGGYATPPLWLNHLFATANRPGRVLADLIKARFPLPRGVSSVNLPILTTGSLAGSQADNAAVPSQDITDSAGSSAVVPLAGFVDVSLQVLEMSPVTAAADWAVFTDLSEATDAQLETQLIAGSGAAPIQLRGVTNVAGVNNVAFSGAATGAAMYPYFGRVAAQVGDNRLRPPECWLMRTSRWAWLETSEDTAGRPFGLHSPNYLGNTHDTPDPVGGLLGWPVFLDDAIPANLAGNPGSFTGGGTQDTIICLRPSDLILLESDTHSMAAREPGSGTLGARIESHVYAAAIARHPAGIGVIGGTGTAVQAGF